MKELLAAFRMFFVLTVLTGIVYPIAITAVAQIIFPAASNGQLIEVGGKFVGSSLIAQKFESNRYFWPRPSGADYNSTASSGTNLGPTSSDLKKQFDEKKAQLGEDAPQDMLFASGSGLDPHISPESAKFQAVRIAKSRGLPIEVVQQLIEEQTESRQYGIFGEPRVNVLALNLLLDRKSNPANKTGN